MGPSSQAQASNKTWSSATFTHYDDHVYDSEVAQISSYVDSDGANTKSQKLARIQIVKESEKEKDQGRIFLWFGLSSFALIVIIAICTMVVISKSKYLNFSKYSRFLAYI